MNKNTNSNGIGFFGLLQLIFITLKLVGVLSWSWLWVLSPTWIGLLLITIIYVIWIILYKTAKRRKENGYSHQQTGSD